MNFHADPLSHYIESPIELFEVFSQVKSIIKANDGIFQVTMVTRALIAMAFSMVPSDDRAGYIHHSRYIN